MGIDLGELTGPVLFFGGPYGNLQATTALRQRARRMGIGPGNIVCTGDVAAYCADPQGTVDLVRRWGVHVVMGNCEESLGFEEPHCGCGFTQDGDCDRLSRQWFAYARDHLDAGAKAWMRGLPRRIFLTLEGRRLAVLHGGAQGINRFIFASTPKGGKAADLHHLDVDGVIGGHAGLPFTQFVDGGLWHNPGAIGMPANDGTPGTWFSVLTPAHGPEPGLVRITHHALDYDHAAAARRLRRSDLPDAYAWALLEGHWPSRDMLPDAEHNLTGRPLSPPVVLWPHRRRDAAE